VVFKRDLDVLTDSLWHMATFLLPYSKISMKEEENNLNCGRWSFRNSRQEGFAWRGRY
jgi:hypothetical protein